MLFAFTGCEEEKNKEIQEEHTDYTIVGIPEFVPAEEKFVDPSKKYVLPDGFLYEYKPEMVFDFTNLLDASADGLMENTRISSSGGEKEAEGLFVTNYIPCTFGDILRVKNADAVYNTSKSGTVKWSFYNSQKKVIGVFYPGSDTSEKMIANENGEIESAEIGYINGKELSEIAYIRLTLHPLEGYSLEDVAISVNEEISYHESGNYVWKRTGYYIPSGWYDEIKDSAFRIRDYNLTEGKTASFLLTSDIHLDPTSERQDYLGNIGKISAEIMRRCGIPFFMNLGDVFTQSTGHGISVFDGFTEELMEIFFPIPQKNILMTVGNHDGATGKVETSGDPIYYRNQLNNEQRAEVFFGWQKFSNPEKRFGEDGTYYYLDDHNTKTRYIMLNSFWTEWEGDSETGFVEDVQHAFMQTPHYGEKQMQWFANEALDMPKGYSAVIGTHHASSPKDWEIFKNILSAYVEKEGYIGFYEGEQEWQAYSIEVDFESAEGEVIAIFQGHNHLDNVDTETFAVPCINITTAGAYYDVRDKNAPERISGTETETAIDIVTIDKEERIIYLTRVGVGRDRKVEY